MSYHYVALQNGKPLYAASRVFMQTYLRLYAAIGVNADYVNLDVEEDEEQSTVWHITARACSDGSLIPLKSPVKIVAY